MGIYWKLKTLASSKGIYRAKDLQRKITQKTGVIVSLQNICNLLNDKPQGVKLKTLEIICTTLDCKLGDFCDVTPGKFDTSEIRKLSFKNTPQKLRGKSEFPDPRDYRT
jgi:DNA-binding Xre family transcriptional regulator